MSPISGFIVHPPAGRRRALGAEPRADLLPDLVHVTDSRVLELLSAAPAPGATAA